MPPRLHERHEQGRVAHGEQHAEGADRERYRVQLPAGQHVQQRGHRDQGQQHRAAEIGGDHHDPAVAEPVRPRARVQGEDQAGQPDGGGQEAHLGRVGVQREDAGVRIATDET